MLHLFFFFSYVNGHQNCLVSDILQNTFVCVCVLEKNEIQNYPNKHEQKVMTALANTSSVPT